MQRGEIYWVHLPAPVGSGPGYTRPMLVIQADYLNASRLPTVVFCALSSNQRLARFPPNLLLKRSDTGLPRDSVFLPTELFTVDHSVIGDLAGRVPDDLMPAVDAALRQVLSL
jgi:mRNA interferase MazF